MKLLKLKINAPYSSLDNGFEFDFRKSYTENGVNDWRDFHPFCFAGLNGSGKSNVLEALANIFFHLESCANIHQPKNFIDNFPTIHSYPNAYQLEYYITPNTTTDYTIKNMVKVEVVKKVDEIPKMYIIPYPFEYDKKQEKEVRQEVKTIGDKKKKITAGSKRYLPEFIVGYSSGENEILSIPFLKSRLLLYDEYHQAVVENEKYESPESRMIYVDYEMSQAVLLSNYLFQNETVLEPLVNGLGILDIKRFRLNIGLQKIKDVPIIQQFDKKIQAFKNCATAIFQNESHLVLDFWVNEATKRAFQNKKNFDGIFDLFQSFQILHTLNYWTISPEIKSEIYDSKGFYPEYKIPTPSYRDHLFDFSEYFIEKHNKVKGTTHRLLLKNLSDGEQQFLHSLGICLLLKGKSALLLLDEPETHFNPDWRSKFINTLKDSLEKSGSNHLKRDILITSHSPFIISDCKKDKVFIFKNGEVNNPKKNTYGTSVNILLEEIFGKEETISDLAISDIEKLKKLPMSTLEEIEKVKEASRILGESLEKVLLFRQLLLKEKQIKTQDAKNI